jgi:ABC-2 type transport system permease protein
MELAPPDLEEVFLRLTGRWHERLPTLLYKELLRFWKVSVQTVAAPVLTALLYLLVFAQALADHVQPFHGVIPTPRSWSRAGDDERAAERVRQQLLVADPVEGHRQPIVFVLLPPLSPGDLRRLRARGRRARPGGGGRRARGDRVVRAAGRRALLGLAFAVLGSAILGTLGLIAGIWAEKFDQIAAFQNFVIMPLTFLAGVFYSVHSLPRASGRRSRTPTRSST